MSDFTIYHNARCSKSRQTLQILLDHNIKPTIVEYLKQPLSKDLLGQLLKNLGLTARQLICTKESEYKDLGLADVSLSEEQLIVAMLANPKLIERPIVTKGQRAIIGRPPESVLELI